MDSGPSLLSLCKRKYALMISNDASQWKYLKQLPMEIMEELLLEVPPIVLEALHQELLGSSVFQHGQESAFITFTCQISHKRKRTEEHRVSSTGGTSIRSEHFSKKGIDQNDRYGGETKAVLDDIFNSVWEKNFRIRWPEPAKLAKFHLVTELSDGCEGICGSGGDWRQFYWESHLQNCLYEAVAQGRVPSFEGSIADVSISEKILKHIGLGENLLLMPDGLVTLRDHLEKFGHHAKYLRVRNVLCVEEMVNLLRHSRIRAITFGDLKRIPHIDNAYRILREHIRTLVAVELYHCRISSDVLSNIFVSLTNEGDLTHHIKVFSVVSSEILVHDKDKFLTTFYQFFQAGRYLHSLSFRENGFEPKIARFMFDVIRCSDSCLSVLELCDNKLSGLHCTEDKSVDSFHMVPANESRVLRSLSVLCLRGNLLTSKDMGILSKSLLSMPELKQLDLSDNPIGDDGIKALLPYFQAFLNHSMPLKDLKIENCDITSFGASILFNTLSPQTNALRLLSISNNSLGSSIALSLGNFLKKQCVKSLEIEDVGLGPSGFEQLQQEAADFKYLVSINISKNFGRWHAAAMLAIIISESSSIRFIDASYNFLCFESLKVIADALHQSRGNIEWIDVRGNWYADYAKLSNLFDKFKFNNKPVVFLSSSMSPSYLHDDDP